MVGVRWDPIETDDPAAGAAGGLVLPPVTPKPKPAVVSPVPSSAPPSGNAPTATPPGLTAPVSPAAPDASEPIPVDLVSAEVPGEVVAPVAAKRTRSGLSVPVKIPTAAGLYRLVATVHQPDGVAYDAASQALVPALIVHVTGRLTATYDAPAAVNAIAGRPVTLRVNVTNLGATAWGSPAVAARLGGAELQPARRATVVARWFDLAAAGAGLPAQDSSSLLPPGLAPRHSSKAVLGLTAPAIPGEYLVFVDVIIPGTGSLAVAGVPPALVRVSVSGAPSQAAP
jgi:hypothetical protein